MKLTKSLKDTNFQSSDKKKSNLNSPRYIKEIEFAFKILLIEKTPGFTVGSLSNISEWIVTTLQKFFSNKEKKEAFSNSFYEVNLTPKSKLHALQENYRWVFS